MKRTLATLIVGAAVVASTVGTAASETLARPADRNPPPGIDSDQLCRFVDCSDLRGADLIDNSTTGGLLDFVTSLPSLDLGEESTRDTTIVLVLDGLLPFPSQPTAVDIIQTLIDASLLVARL